MFKSKCDLLSRLYLFMNLLSTNIESIFEFPGELNDKVGLWPTMYPNPA